MPQVVLYWSIRGCNLNVSLSVLLVVQMSEDEVETNHFFWHPFFDMFGSGIRWNGFITKGNIPLWSGMSRPLPLESWGRDGLVPFARHPSSVVSRAPIRERVWWMGGCESHPHSSGFCLVGSRNEMVSLTIRNGFILWKLWEKLMMDYSIPDEVIPETKQLII